MECTFQRAREVAERTIGAPVEPYGYEGPDQYAIIPRHAMWDIAADDTVVVVGKMTGEAQVMPIDHDLMDPWPLVAPKVRGAGRSTRRNRGNSNGR